MASNGGRSACRRESIGRIQSPNHNRAGNPPGLARRERGFDHAITAGPGPPGWWPPAGPWILRLGRNELGHGGPAPGTRPLGGPHAWSTSSARGSMCGGSWRTFPPPRPARVPPRKLATRGLPRRPPTWLTGREAGADRWAVIDDCPMTGDCPGYDRERRVCLLRPDDCEFAPARRETASTVETPVAPAPDPSAKAGAP
jgi:hypothetical protein